MLIQKRKDAIGLFWEDWVEKKEPAVKVVRTPPERTWERPDYLPGLEEALRFDVPLFTDEELVKAAEKNERQVYDVESYPNYFLCMFRSVVSGKTVYFELVGPDAKFSDEQLAKLRWIYNNFVTVGFNSIAYDNVVMALALAGKTVAQIFNATERLIVGQEQAYLVLRSFKAKKLEIDHIDLIEVAPLSASLKAYAGRLHTKKMQDLPFVPGTVLSPEQIAITRLYCCNDLNSTQILHDELKPALKLREQMSAEYGVDLRSKSDAQIAEAVLSHEIEKLNHKRCSRATVVPGSSFRYQIPAWMNYQTANLQWVLDRVRATHFYIAHDGTVSMPAELADLEIPIGNGVYRMGIGGLHSSESCVSVVANENLRVVDRDVASYYPSIILNQGLYPQHLGPAFLTVYRQIVKRRLDAKHAGNKIVADSLKITINGSFGKLGSPYSVLYSPNLLIQVTLTGQLALLMLIEALFMAGVEVFSANTDGIVIMVPKDKEDIVAAIVKWWEDLTQFETEETEYKAVYSRDVNNYIAVKGKGDPKGRFLDEKLGIKTKGAYCERGSSGNSVLSKNPSNLICSDAVLQFLHDGVPLATTIRECKDIRRFTTVRTVKGGGVKDGQYLGKNVRWYYATGVEGEIVYASSGNKVPRSDGAKPLMELPPEFPADIDFEWYEREAEAILEEIAFTPKLAA